VSQPESDPELRLLLEDYGSQARQWLARFASQPRPHPPGSAADSNGRTGPTIHLLIEDFTRRRGEWWTRYQQSPSTSKTTPQSADQADLSLLVEDYYDARHRVLKAARERTTRALPRPVSQDPAPADDIPLDLLVHWDANLTVRGSRRPMVLSLLAHVILVGILIVQPKVLPFKQRPLDLETPNFTMLTPPEDFLKELTQPEPNEGPVSIEFEGKDELPVPVMKPPEQPAPAPPALQPEPEPEPEPEPSPTVEVDPEEPTPEPPPERRDPEPNPEAPPPAIAARSPNPGEFNPDLRLGRPAELPMPKPPSRPAKRPRLQLEDPRTGSPGRAGPAQLGSLALNARPGQLVEGAIRNLSASGGRGGRQAVGDGAGTGGLSGYLPPSPGNAGSNLELLSDPMGVDFRPYLLQVLASVRRNWYAVIPESARLGMNRGSVAIQLRVIRSGNVAKLVIANSSGTSSLDRAAVAGISASNPLPPLPSEYKGSEVSFQFVFRYNLKR
jgi:TonB family protein